MALRFSGSACGVGVGDQLGVGEQHGVDDLEARGAQRPAGLGDLDDRVGDVGHLGLGGAVREGHLGVDAVLVEVAAGQLGVLGVDPDPGGRSVTVWAATSAATARTTRMGRAVALE